MPAVVVPKFAAVTKSERDDGIGGTADGAQPFGRVGGLEHQDAGEADQAQQRHRAPMPSSTGSTTVRRFGAMRIIAPM